MLGEDFVAVKLRFKMMGRRHQSFFRLSAIDSRSPRDGRVVEHLGWYDPHAKEPEKQLSLNRERIEYWLKVGATPSATVHNLLTKQGIAATAAAAKV
jgi:small subunit ribosomal protein S16